VTGSSVSVWKLLILVLSAQQNLQEAEAVADIALYEAEKEDQMGTLRLKAHLQASRGQFKSAVNLLGFCLQSFKQRRKSGN
jgi:hypothetical protein